MEFSEGMRPPEKRHLSQAQVKILDRMIQGLKPKQIAEDLEIGLKTAYKHRQRVYIFFGTRDLSIITQKAFDMNIIPRPKSAPEEQK